MLQPRKYSFEEYKKRMTMFYVDAAFEEEFNKLIDKKVEDLYKSISGINTKEGLMLYISTYEDSLMDILSLIGLSSEKFKRIVTMIRIWDKAEVKTEWDLRKIRREIIQNKEFAEKICLLLLDGKNNETYKRYIPRNYLDYLTLDQNVMKQIEDKDRLKRLIKARQDGKYNNDVGDRVEFTIMKKLEEIKEKYGVGYEREQVVNWIERNMDFVIPNKEDPYVIIESSYQITTGSGMTTKSRDEVVTSQTIRMHNIKNNKNIAFVNLLDGAGWIGRQSDMIKIHNCSDYVIGLQTLDMLESIVVKHVPDSYFTKQQKPTLE
ncbi:DpnII family type II restriction endonuclease [Bacillus sp. FSL M7-0884]|uniref:DpnII family type II restriction endonuclease n=1 Tax=Bacillus sp. FSL M7-0884 TaxID=2921537 RepID=UPI0030F5EA36